MIGVSLDSPSAENKSIMALMGLTSILVGAFIAAPVGGL